MLLRIVALGTPIITILIISAFPAIVTFLVGQNGRTEQKRLDEKTACIRNIFQSLKFNKNVIRSRI
jgi:hypothetical protein